VENIDFTKMSSRGHIVVPKNIRDVLHLQSGERFMIFANGDTLILKKIQKPLDADIDEMFAESQRLAKEKGLKPEDVEKAIQSVRHESGN
jgi:AbrB family looped-hinge helix DNA binding protein